MHSVLVLEDSPTLARGFARLIRGHLGYDTVVAKTLADARAALARPEARFLAALVDLHLPDAQGMEVVQAITAYHVPVVVITADTSEETRRALQRHRVVDYLLKDSPAVADNLLRTLTRLDRNRGLRVLIADDSRLVRASLRQLAERQNLQVAEAESGEAALALVEAFDDIKVVLTDFDMPGMRGDMTVKQTRVSPRCLTDFDMPGMRGDELAARLRRKRRRDEMAIIGISGGRADLMTANFLKAGATDFLHKPFSDEEFTLRITNTLDALENVQALAAASTCDPLTRLYNRKHFFQLAPALLKRPPVSAALLDVDHLSAINATYGQEGGDAVLKHLAKLLRATFDEDALVARFGGDEFCVLFSATPEPVAVQHIRAFRDALARSAAVYGDHDLPITLSIGIAASNGESLDGLLREADMALFTAKKQGTNALTCRHDADAVAHHIRHENRQHPLDAG